MAFFENIGKKITDAGQGVALQTKKLTDTTRLNAKIAENKEKMSQLLFEMGNDYYKKHRKDAACEEQEYIDQVNALFYDILKWQKEIEQIKSADVCKVCGARIEAGAAFCMSCGAGLGADEMEVDESAGGTTRRCHICGAAVEEGSAFCIYCGTKLANTDNRAEPAMEVEPQSYGRVCPVCGMEAEEEDMFCMNCGTRL